MKESGSKYCGECQIDFKAGEIVYYTWYENRSFCGNCKRLMNERVSAEYLDWEQRIVPSIKS